MLKAAVPVKFETEVTAASAALRRLLAGVSGLTVANVDDNPPAFGRQADLVVEVEVWGRRHRLVAEVIASGQPRFVSMACAQLTALAVGQSASVTPLIIAPYFSPAAQALCREHGCGYLDLEGNAWLTFPGVYIERQVASAPAPERRALQSIFKPKAARILRVMLREPGRAWRVTELAAATGVSLGQVSNVRAKLLDREWATVTDAGLALTQPDALLDAWRADYQAWPGSLRMVYTTLHGAALAEAIRRSLTANETGGRVMLASFSTAAWLAPYGRTSTQYLYAEPTAVDRLLTDLQANPAARGGNVAVIVTDDDGLFLDAVEPAPGVIGTSPVQTYLDLNLTGERGREAAEHLRRELLTWRQ